MAPKYSKSNTYKGGIKLDLERFKKNEIQQVKVHLININTKTLSTLIGILSEDVKLYMELLTASRYYALSDRTIHLLSQGEVDMSATSAEFGADPASNTVSDAGFAEVIDIETEVEIFVVDKIKRAGGAFSKYLHITFI